MAGGGKLSWLRTTTFWDAVLLLVGLAALFFGLDYWLEADGLVRFWAMEALFERGQLSDMRFSLIGPLFSAPLYLLGKLFGQPQAWCLRYNFLLFLAALVGLELLLKDMLSVRVRRRFLLLLSLASMFPHHLSTYFGEVFSSLAFTLGTIAVVKAGTSWGWGLLVMGAVNTPATLPALGAITAWLAWQWRKPKLLLVPLVALLLIGAEAWIRRGSPFVTGYEGDHGFRTFMPYSGCPGFCYPFLFGLLSILFSFGKGLLFFSPGIFLFSPSLGRQQDAKLRGMLYLWLVLLAGLVLVYSSWWSWYGGWFWGARFFLLAAVPASLILALRLENESLGLLADLTTLLALALSFWVGANGAVFGLRGLEHLMANNYAQEAYSWYIPEFSPLWYPLVKGLRPSAGGVCLLVIFGVVFVYLAFPLVTRMVRKARHSLRRECVPPP